MDKQAEHRYMRVQSLTTRELSLKEEYDAIQDMLRKADEREKGGDFEIVPVPK